MPNAYYPEGGIGQHELSMLPSDPVTAADNEVDLQTDHQKYREAFDLYASIRAKAAS